MLVQWYILYISLRNYFVSALRPAAMCIMDKWFHATVNWAIVDWYATGKNIIHVTDFKSLEIVDSLGQFNLMLIFR